MDAAPRNDTWVAAIYRAGDHQPSGSAVLIDRRRLLACAHVVRSAEQSPSDIEIAFPKSDDPFYPRIAVAAIKLAPQEYADIAILEMAEPAPEFASAAPLRRPRTQDLVGRRWWSYGFPRGDFIGNDAYGKVGTALAFGWIRLDTDSVYAVEAGYSGAGLWSPDYGAVVGIVGHAHGNGDGRALTIDAAIRCFPEEQLNELTEWRLVEDTPEQLSAWGWSLAFDEEAPRHWKPRARGVTIDSEQGYRFRGRRRALERIIGWVDREEPDRHVLLVTGSPGSGKSAVLGRVVTTADVDLAPHIPDDAALKATLGSVACAVHAKGKTALDVAQEIARACSAGIPLRLEDAVPGIRIALLERELPTKFTVILDALDEAVSPVEVRSIIRKLLVPLVETCSNLGVNVVVGTRRRDAAGVLIDAFGPAAVLIDMDAAEFFVQKDLEAYALATLQLRGDERENNPYSDVSVALPVAQRIAELAAPNFLVAGLVARAHGLHDKEAVTLDALGFASDVGAALGEYLSRMAPVGGVSAGELLLPLAFAESPGLELKVWAAVLEGLTGRRISDRQLTAFAGGNAANFLVETTTLIDPRPSGRPREVRSYRLFHQALNDSLLGSRAELYGREDDERRITETMVALGLAEGWASAPQYLLKALPGHAARCGKVDVLLLMDEYLLHADLRRLLLAGEHVHGADAGSRLRLLRASPWAFEASAVDRAAMFSVTEQLEDLPLVFGSRPGLPYKATWTSVSRDVEQNGFRGHVGGVRAVCGIRLAGQELIASGGADGKARIWDPYSGEVLQLISGHAGELRALCVFETTNGPVLASGGDDHTVRLWDPEMETVVRVLEGHAGEVRAVCEVRNSKGSSYLASAGDDMSIRIWDGESGHPRMVLEGHGGWIWSLCDLTIGAEHVLASASDDQTIRLWAVNDGRLLRVLAGHRGAIRSICQVQLNGRSYLASASADRTVRLWDPTSGTSKTLVGHTSPVMSVCEVRYQGKVAIASAGNDRTIRLWDPVSGQALSVLDGHTGWIRDLCVVGNRLVSGSDDASIRTWDLDSGVSVQHFRGRETWVRAICSIGSGAAASIASAHPDGSVRLWDPDNGSLLSELHGHEGAVMALCAAERDGTEVIVSSGRDRTIRFWDASSGECEQILRGHTGWVRAVCSVKTAAGDLIVSGGNDETVRIWGGENWRELNTLRGHAGDVRVLCAAPDRVVSAGEDGLVRVWNVASGQLEHALIGHAGAVMGLCHCVSQGKDLIASAGMDGTVRVWDLLSGELVRILEGHTGWVMAVASTVLEGRSYLVSLGNDDHSIRLWELTTGVTKRVIPIHHEGIAVATAGDHDIYLALSAGVLAISVPHV